MGLHPATYFFAWGAFAATIQSIDLAALAWVAILLVPCVLSCAFQRSMRLFRRSRWLLISIMVLFCLATPGQHFSGVLGDLGLTVEGVTMAFEHVTRLILLLASLALLHEYLTTEGLLVGMYWWLAPLSAYAGLRERIVVRLMLVLDYAESERARTWREWLYPEAQPGPSQLLLPSPRLLLLDGLAMSSLVAALVWVNT